jgi:uncharacterized metal-binding protein YceD (DUF177 family)
MSEIPAPEFSRPLPVERIKPAGIEEKLSASEKERRLLAERFGLLDLSRLEAQLDVYPGEGRTIAVTGTLVADVVQQCVVTLEPLPAHIEEEIDVIFAPEVAADDEEEAEPIMDDTVDLGELVAQHLGASLDPYPRKPGQAFVELEYGTSGNVISPFAKLAELKKKGDRD